MDLGLLMAWSKCLMPLQMALFDFVFVFILAATAVAASVRSPFWAAWPGLNEKPYFSWCWPQFLTCDRWRLSGCCSSANLLLSLWAAFLAAAPTAAAWRGLISFLGWAAKVMHLLGPKNKTEIKTENPNAKATPKTNQIQVRFQFQIRFKMRITVGDFCG